MGTRQRLVGYLALRVAKWYLRYRLRSRMAAARRLVHALGRVLRAGVAGLGIIAVVAVAVRRIRG